MILAWFTTPVPLAGWQQLLLLFPLCLAVAVVYKATKLSDLRQLPRAAVITWVSIVVGMLGLGAGLYLLHRMVA